MSEGRVVAAFAPGYAFRFFSVARGTLYGRAGEFPNASPGERLVTWPT